MLTTHVITDAITQLIEQTESQSTCIKPDETINREPFNQTAQALTDWFLSQEFQCDQAIYMSLLPYSIMISLIFNISDFGNTDHILVTCLQRDEQNGQLAFLTEHHLLLFLLLYSVYSKIDSQIFSGLATRFPVLIWSLYVRLFSQMGFCTIYPQNSQTNLVDLFVTHPIPPKSPFEPQLLTMACHSWFNAVYCEPTSAYPIMEKVNAYFEDRFQSTQLPSHIVSHTNKPVFLIISEHGIEQSIVMQQYYAFLFNHLSAHFDVRHIGPEVIDDLAYFDLTVSYNYCEMDEQALAALVARQHARIIYYTGLGASAKVFAMAVQRFAPIQICGFGHASSSRLSTIDYMLVERACVSSPSLFTEKLLLLPDHSMPYVSHLKDAAATRLPVTRPMEQPIRLVVNVGYKKYSPRFIDICCEINARCQPHITWCFLTQASGVPFFHVAHHIKQRIPQASVEPILPWHAYVEKLAQHDLQLTSFPYGNGNSTVDTLVQGIPVIIMDSAYVCGRYDRNILSDFSCCDALIAGSAQEYIDKVIHFISDREHLRTISQTLLDELPRAKLITSPSEAVCQDTFCQSILWLMANHERLQLSDQQCYDMSDCLAERPQNRPNPSSASS